jgi:hypothetical protein
MGQKIIYGIMIILSLALAGIISYVSTETSFQYTFLYTMVGVLTSNHFKKEKN